MEKTLKGKRALITGASSGIGESTAILFAEQGADLCLVSRRKEALERIASRCRDMGVRVLEIPADITQEAQVKEMALTYTKEFKGIDLLINNAGYGKYGPFLTLPIEEWDRMWQVNVRGMVLVTQVLVPLMIPAGTGHIVNVSSIHGIHTSGNASAYCATKFAVTGLTEALAKELWKYGIKVSTVCPGGVRTPFMGMDPQVKNPDFLEPQEVARVILDVVTAPGKALIMQVIVAPRSRPFMVQEIP